MAATEAFKEVVWLRGLTREFGLNSEDITVYCDNQSVLHWIKNPMLHVRSKHIDIKYHFIRELVSQKKVLAKKVSIEENPADMLTKRSLLSSLDTV